MIDFKLKLIELNISYKECKYIYGVNSTIFKEQTELESDYFVKIMKTYDDFVIEICRKNLRHDTIFLNRPYLLIDCIQFLECKSFTELKNLFEITDYETENPYHEKLDEIQSRIDRIKKLNILTGEE